jgi:hypothetical protein
MLLAEPMTRLPSNERIVSPRVKGMALGDSYKRQKASFYDSVFLDGLAGII